MRRLSTVLITAALALGLPLLAVAQDNDIDKINGSVQVEAGQRAGAVSTVNGAVHIADGAVVHKASTVNGAIELGDKAQASEIGTVNGGISLGNGSRISGEVSWTTSTARSRWTAPMSPAAFAPSAATSRLVPTPTSKVASWSTNPVAGSTSTAARRWW
jgi:hypothetical protein